MSLFRETDAFKTAYDRFVKAAFEEEVTRVLDPQIQEIEWRKFKPLSEGAFPVTAASAVAAIREQELRYRNPCSRCEKNKSFRIKTATIVFWNDDTKTVVKAENEPFDPEKGLAMAISKKFLGNKGNYFQTFKKYIKEDTK